MTHSARRGNGATWAQTRQFGRHVVEVQSHILGEAEDPPPVQLAIETQCPRDVEADLGSAASAPDGGTDLDDASPTRVNPNAILESSGKADTTDLHVDSPSAGSRASGCAFRGSNVTGGAGALGLLLVLARRRRDRR
jgi:hypothetical protein